MANHCSILNSFKLQSFHLKNTFLHICILSNTFDNFLVFPLTPIFRFCHGNVNTATIKYSFILGCLGCFGKDNSFITARTVHSSCVIQSEDVSTEYIIQMGGYKIKIFHIYNDITLILIVIWFSFWYQMNISLNYRQ